MNIVSLQIGHMQGWLPNTHLPAEGLSGHAPKNFVPGAVYAQIKQRDLRTCLVILFLTWGLCASVLSRMTE